MFLESIEAVFMALLLATCIHAHDTPKAGPNTLVPRLASSKYDKTRKRSAAINNEWVDCTAHNSYNKGNELGRKPVPEKVGKILNPVEDAATTDSRTRANYLIIMRADICWASIDCMDTGGSTRTPNIDALAKQGRHFSNFHGSTALCMPCRYELYTSLLPPISGAITNRHPTGTLKNVNNDKLGAISRVC
jgi:Sulfatase